MNIENLYRDSDWRDDPRGPQDLDFRVEGKHGTMLSNFWLAGGEGKKPTVLLLHGYPGNEQNLDLMRGLQRTGFNVYTFHYSGSWGSGGSFSFGGVIDDAISAFEYIKDNADEYGVDTDKLFTIGHSMGGFAASHLTASVSGLKGTILLAPYDFGRQYTLGKQNGGEDWVLIDELIKYGVPCLATDYHLQMRELDAHPEYALETLAPELAKRRVYIIEASYDDCAVPEKHCRFLSGAIKKNMPEKAGGTLEYCSMPTGHSFIDHRIELIDNVARKLIEWVDND